MEISFMVLGLILIVLSCGEMINQKLSIKFIIYEKRALNAKSCVKVKTKSLLILCYFRFSFYSRLFLSPHSYFVDSIRQRAKWILFIFILASILTTTWHRLYKKFHNEKITEIKYELQLSFNHKSSACLKMREMQNLSFNSYFVFAIYFHVAVLK